MRQILTRIVAGDGRRKTRLHDYKGSCIDLPGLVYLPHTLVSTVALKLLGKRFAVPWLGWRAIRHLDVLIQKDWRVLEFGSGMSTLWFAQRCAQVVSVEADPAWYTRVKRGLTEKRLVNVDFRLATLEEYMDVPEYPDRWFDLILIDGEDRAGCARTALRKAKSGGYVYLDNSDVYRAAEEILLDAVRRDRGRIRYFTDLYPSYFGVNQGLLVRLSE